MLCNDPISAPVLDIRRVGDVLYIMYNGDYLPSIDLSDLDNGGGGGENNSIVKIAVSTNGQVLFTNAIPVDATLNSVLVNGIEYFTDADVNEASYVVVNRNITWTGGFDLKTTDKIVLKITNNGSN